MQVHVEALECRICLSAEPTLVPIGCKCKGTLGLAHAACAARWFVERNLSICEICKSPVVVGVSWITYPRLLRSIAVVVSALSVIAFVLSVSAGFVMK